jgi:molybdopterin molybdotransferase
MKRFFKVKTVAEVLDLIGRFERLADEEVTLTAARGRVLAAPVRAGENVPSFDRVTMDGYAVRAQDTFGATESLPGLFSLVGEVAMGERPQGHIGPGQTMRIWTGGMLPEGADAVVMVEYARVVDQNTVELARAVAPYDHVIRPGEDVKEGEVLLKQGARLRPQDVGLLAALGMGRVVVTRVPRVAVISTGDEVVPIEDRPAPGQVRDINTYSLGALIESAHALPLHLGLVRDDPGELRAVVAKGLAQADTVILSGGSSVGVRDYTVEVFSSLPDSEILVHGVSVSPGKPTILARAGKKSLWGLPGHAVSAMIIFDLFLRPFIKRLCGEETGGERPGRFVEAVLVRNVASVHGREDYVRVRLERTGDGGLMAHPVLGKSGLISTMVKADGLIRIGLNSEGLVRGSRVRVDLFEP